MLYSYLLLTMKQATILTIILGVLLLVVVGLILRNTLFKAVAAGLQVKSVPQSTVFLDDKNLGQTPLEELNLKPGEFSLKLVPQTLTGNLSPWETRIKLAGNTQAIVSWEFGETTSSSSGEIMTLEKITDKKSASLTVISSPDSSLVKVDGEPRGFTPLNLDKLEEEDRRITLSAPGFKEKSIEVKLLKSFKLILNVKLAEETTTEKEKISPATTPTTTPTPGASGKATPTPVKLEKPYVTIKETPTGWLRVRMEPSTVATEAARVNPGESYPLLEEKAGWYKIRYAAGKEGWISGQYAEKFE